MILSDKDIQDRQPSLVQGINDESQIQPASIDLRLSDDFIVSGNKKRTRCQLVFAREFILGSTIETVHIPNDLVGVIDGRSTWARRGLMVHITAGYIDPGFSGNITLEIVNLSGKTIHVTSGDRICQIRFHTLKTPCLKPYGIERGSHYHGKTSSGTVQ